MTVKRNWVTDRESFMSQFCGLLLHITRGFQWIDKSHWIYCEYTMKTKPSGVIGGCSVGDVALFLKKKSVMDRRCFFPQRCGHVSGVF